MRISRETMYLWDVAAKEEPISSLIPDRDYRGLNQQDSQLRIWLPESAKIGLMEVVKRQQTSLTAFLTEYFVTYLYGYHELLRMRDERIGLYEAQDAEPLTRFNAEAAVDLTPKLGKNIYAIKIFIAERLKLDLEQRAKTSNLSLGELTRGLICQHIFGRNYGVPKSEISDSDLLIAKDWEQQDPDDQE